MPPFPAACTPCRCREACLEQIELGNACETDGSGSGPGATAINYRQLASDLELLQVRIGGGGALTRNSGGGGGSRWEEGRVGDSLAAPSLGRRGTGKN